MDQNGYPEQHRLHDAVAKAIIVSEQFEDRGCQVTARAHLLETTWECRLEIVFPSETVDDAHSYREGDFASADDALRAAKAMASRIISNETGPRGAREIIGGQKKPARGE